MNVTFPARYRDRLGLVETKILNDGQTLTMEIRGQQFESSDFDDFRPVGGDPKLLDSFTFANGSLCSCSIEAEIPVLVATTSGQEHVHVKVDLEFGDPLPNGRMDRFGMKLSLTFQQENLVSSGTSGGFFRDELLDLQQQLPSGTYLKACINCAFSDYSPAGHGCFGGLACFRDNKAGYLGVASKWDLFRIWESMTEFVQETHVCPEFERRRPNTGCRG